MDVRHGFVLRFEPGSPGDAAVLPKLVAALADEGLRVRMAAADALSKIVSRSNLQVGDGKLQSIAAIAGGTLLVVSRENVFGLDNRIHIQDCASLSKNSLRTITIMTRVAVPLLRLLLKMRATRPCQFN